MVLSKLLHPSGYIAALSAVDGLDDRQVQRVRAQLETFRYQYHRQWQGQLAMNRAGYRLIPLSVLPVWLVLLAVASLAGFSPGPAGSAGFAVISAACATIPVIAAVRAILTPAGQYRHDFSSLSALVAFPLVVIVIDAAAAAGYARHMLPQTGWWAAVVLDLIAAPAALACLPIAWACVEIPRFRRTRMLVRQDPLLWAADALLIVLHDLRSARGHRGLEQRLYYCRNLEFAAHCLTTYLLPLARDRHLGSETWLAHRAAGWTEAVRYLQRQVIAPVPGRQGKAEAFLAHEVRCLATGDMGALTWRAPPPGPSHRATARQKAIAAARAVAVAALPLIAVLAAQPFIHASLGIFNWARIVTAFWALLYVLLSLDPALRDKIGAARDLADLIQTVPGPVSRDSPQQRRANQA